MEFAIKHCDEQKNNKINNPMGLDPLLRYGELNLNIILLILKCCVILDDQCV